MKIVSLSFVAALAFVSSLASAAVDSPVAVQDVRFLQVNSTDETTPQKKKCKTQHPNETATTMDGSSTKTNNSAQGSVNMTSASAQATANISDGGSKSMAKTAVIASVGAIAFAALILFFARSGCKGQSSSASTEKDVRVVDTTPVKAAPSVAPAPVDAGSVTDSEVTGETGADRV